MRSLQKHEAQALKFIPALLAAGLAVAGCGADRPIHYHSIELPAHSAAPAAGDPLPVSLLVGHFTAAHVYREDRLVYRQGAGELDTYHSQRWAEPPTEILEHLVLQALRDSGRFRSVAVQRGNARGDYVLRGRLENFEEVVAANNLGRIRLEVELDDTKNAAVLWSHSFSEEEPIQGKSMEAVVDALQRAAARAVTALSSSVAEYFAAHPPLPQGQQP